jgi:hypothetical protein
MKEAVTLYALEVWDVAMAQNNSALSATRQGWAAFGCGAAFIVGMILIALKVPTPTVFQYFVFRSVLSVAIAGFAAFIPGFLEVRIKPWIHATGAIGVFVVVYILNPAQLAVGAPTPLPSPTAIPSSVR